jgi:hypothetical protein
MNQKHNTERSAVTQAGVVMAMSPALPEVKSSPLGWIGRLFKTRVEAPENVNGSDNRDPQALAEQPEPLDPQYDLTSVMLDEFHDLDNQQSSVSSVPFHLPPPPVPPDTSRVAVSPDPLGWVFPDEEKVELRIEKVAVPIFSTDKNVVQLGVVKNSDGSLYKKDDNYWFAAADASGFLGWATTKPLLQRSIAKKQLHIGDEYVDVVSEKDFYRVALARQTPAVAKLVKYAVDFIQSSFIVFEKKKFDLTRISSIHLLCESWAIQYRRAETEKARSDQLEARSQDETRKVEKFVENFNKLEMYNQRFVDGYSDLEQRCHELEGKCKELVQRCGKLDGAGRASIAANEKVVALEGAYANLQKKIDEQQKRIAELEAQLGKTKKYYMVKDILWIRDMFEYRPELNLRIGTWLAEKSKAMGYAPRFTGKGQFYHSVVVEAFRESLAADPSLFIRFRKSEA